MVDPELQHQTVGDAGRQSLGATIGYALLGFLGLGASILVGWYVTQRPEVLASYGPQAYYFLLILLGLTAAIFLFGVLRSYATIKGNQFGWAVELGGPAAFGALLVAGGYFFGIPSGEFALTLFLKGEQSPSEMAKDATIVVDIEGRRDRHPVSAAGDATIQGIPSRLRNAELPIGFESKSYRLKESQKTYRIPLNAAVIYIDVIPIGDETRIPGPAPDLVHPAFTSIYEVAPEIKRVRGPAHLSNDAYQAEYEGAHVLWIKPLMTIFVLHKNDHKKDQGNKLTRYRKSSWATDSDLFDEEKARTIFRTPADKHPPHGGIANLWRTDPEHWKWVGWLEWQCRFLGKVYYQQFENGIVLGTFRAHPTQDEGQIIAILDDDTWRPLNVSQQVPKCEQVFEQFPK
jgi:hypothetical protein